MSINEITGDKLQTKTGDKESKESFDKGWDNIFSKSEAKRRACQQEFPWVSGEPATEVEQDSSGCCGGCH